jgi:programmed cell death 6-interacting protein
MVSAKIPKEVSEPLSMLGEQGELGRTLFARLVPYSVHVAASIYADKRDRTINKIIEELDELTAQMHETLSSLGLPGSLQALEKPLGLPPGLIAHAEEIRQQDGIDRLVRSVEETNRLKASDSSTYEEGVQFLRTEMEEDDAARKRYGTDRWRRPPPDQAAPKLYAQIDEIGGYLKSAATSDETVLKKIRENEKYFVLLSGKDRDLENFVPSSKRGTIPPAMEREVVRLRGCLNEIGKIESRRHRKIEALKAKAKQDDVNPDLLKEATRLEREFPMQNIEAVQFEALFDRRLQRYDTDRAAINQESSDQAQTMKRLRDANAAFNNARRGDTSTRQREIALQQLEQAYFKYKEIISNLDAGRKFYNDLARITARFRDEARNFAYARRAEATALAQDITNRNMQSLSMQDIQQQQQQDISSPVQQRAAEQPLTAPTPTRVSMGPVTGSWNPEMGIRFAPPGGAAPPPQAAPKNPPGPQDGTWDPSKGFRFS